MKKLNFIKIYTFLNAFLLGFYLYSVQAMEIDDIITIKSDNRKNIVMKLKLNQNLSNLRLELTHKNRMAKNDVFLSAQNIEVFEDEEQQWEVKDILNNNCISLKYRDPVRTPEFIEKTYLELATKFKEEENEFWEKIQEHCLRKKCIKIKVRYAPEALYNRIFPIKDQRPWVNKERTALSKEMNKLDYKLYTTCTGSIYNKIVAIRYEYNQLTGNQLPLLISMRANCVLSDASMSDYEKMEWKW
jgi:hypothetical protein